MSEFSVEPVEIGRRRADTANFLYLTEQGREIEIVYRLWILRSSSRTIIVDTGPPLREAHRRGITDVRPVSEALAERGIDAAQIDTVLLTHLHWDHASNADQFPKAIFLAQRSEIEFFKSKARKHPSLDRFFSDEALLLDLVRTGRIKPVDGDLEVCPGIRTHAVGGHTPGSQMIMIDTARGTAVITGDAIPLKRNFVENIPSGIVVNVFDAIAALDFVRQLHPCTLFLAHDIDDRLEMAASS